MRIIVHAGLHKTGTTAVQSAWEKTFSSGGGPIYYPPPVADGPGHARAAWWLLGCDELPHTPMRELVDAASPDVQVLLLSAEDFDYMRREHTRRFTEALAGHQVTVLLTLTRPARRWPSAWQEMVKHGLTEGQFAARHKIAEYAQMRRRRLARLVRSFGVDDVRIRLVRSSPHEDGLAQDLLRLCDVQATVAEAERVNASIGVEETHLLRALNERYPDSLSSGVGQALLTALAASPQWREAVPRHFPAIDPAVTRYLVSAARQEADALGRMRDSGRIVLDDPHGLLPRWGEIG